MNREQPLIDINKKYNLEPVLTKYLPLLNQREILFAAHVTHAETEEQQMVNYLRSQGHKDKDIIETCREPILRLNQEEVSRIFGLD